MAEESRADRDDVTGASGGAATSGGAAVSGTRAADGWMEFEVIRRWGAVAHAATPEEVAAGTPEGRLRAAYERYARDRDFGVLRLAIMEYRGETGSKQP